MYPDVCRYVPDRGYLTALLAHLQTQLPLCGADALSMAVWAVAALRQPLPSADWGAQWCDAAMAAAEEFGPQAFAHGLSGMAALRMQPPAALMQVRLPLLQAHAPKPSGLLDGQPPGCTHYQHAAACLCLLLRRCRSSTSPHVCWLHLGCNSKGDTRNQLYTVRACVCPTGPDAACQRLPVELELHGAGPSGGGTGRPALEAQRCLDDGETGTGRGLTQDGVPSMSAALSAGCTQPSIGSRKVQAHTASASECCRCRVSQGVCPSAAGLTAALLRCTAATAVAAVACPATAGICVAGVSAAACL